jgi:hypothetical protein
MTVARVDLTKVTKRVVSALNAGVAGTYAVTVADDRRSAGEITDALLAADAQVCLAVCETTGHGYRALFFGDFTLGNGDVLPDRIGAPAHIMITHVSGESPRAGAFDKDLSVADIERWRANAGALYGASVGAASSSLNGFYVVSGERLFYTGFSATVTAAVFVRSGACQAPEAYEDAVFALAVSNLVKEGDSAPFLSAFLNEGNNYLAMIRSNAMVIPPLQMAQAA